MFLQSQTHCEIVHIFMMRKCVFVAIWWIFVVTNLLYLCTLVVTKTLNFIPVVVFSLVTKHGQIGGRFIPITCIQFVHLVFFCTWTDEICLLIDGYFGDHKRSSKLWQPETVHALGMNTPTVKLCWPQNIQNWLSASYFLYMSFNSI